MLFVCLFGKLLVVYGLSKAESISIDIDIAVEVLGLTLVHFMVFIGLTKLDEIILKSCFAYSWL